MTTMKAVVFDEFGDVDVFHEAEVEVPVLTKGSILIKQAAIAMDPYDVKFRAGAVGYAALQTALYRGASKIYTTSLPTDIDYLHELNADIETIDFTTQKFTDVIPESSVDTVVEIIGGNNALGSMKVLKEGGRIVSTVPLGDDVKAARDAKNIKGDYYVMQSTTEVLTKLMEHLGNGDYKVAVAEVKPFNLENLKEGHKIVESQAVRGKVVLTF